MILNSIFNDDINFLVLRTYHDLHINTPEYPDDIDILTDDYSKVLACIKPYLVRIDNPYVGHIIKFNNKKIKIDVRIIGDNYYDCNWEKQMLKNKILYNNFYVLDPKNYKYSILYHCLIHKPNISEKYHDFIKSEFKTLNKNNLCLQLEKFMSNHSYQL